MKSDMIEELGNPTSIKETRPMFYDFLTLKTLGPKIFTTVVYEMHKN